MLIMPLMKNSKKVPSIKVNIPLKKKPLSFCFAHGFAFPRQKGTDEMIKKMGIKDSHMMSMCKSDPRLVRNSLLSYPSCLKLSLISLSSSVGSNENDSGSYSKTVSNGSKVTISTRAPNRIEVTPGTMKFNIIRCTITCKSLIDDSI